MKRDAVAAMASTRRWRRRDAVAVRDSTRLAREPRQFATASLHTGYDNKMNNQFWVCDFPRRTTPMVQQATPEAEVDDRDAADACLKERIGAVKGDALIKFAKGDRSRVCLLYTSPSPRDKRQSRMPSSA